MAEYACRISNTASTSVVQFDNCKDYYEFYTIKKIIEIDWTSEFDELTLKERPGRYFHTYVCTALNSKD